MVKHGGRLQISSALAGNLSIDGQFKARLKPDQVVRLDEVPPGTHLITLDPEDVRQGARDRVALLTTDSLTRVSFGEQPLEGLTDQQRIDLKGTFRNIGLYSEGQVAASSGFLSLELFGLTGFWPIGDVYFRASALPLLGGTTYWSLWSQSVWYPANMRYRDSQDAHSNMSIEGGATWLINERILGIAGARLGLWYGTITGFSGAQEGFDSRGELLIGIVAKLGLGFTMAWDVSVGLYGANAMLSGEVPFDGFNGTLAMLGVGSTVSFGYVF